MTPDPDLVDWTAVPGAGVGDKVGGARHYQGSETQAAIIWKCPACGAEQQGPLHEGCETCGSGKDASKHVGIDPIVRKADKAALRSDNIDLVVPVVSADANTAFLAWLAQRPLEQPLLIPLLAEAFMAGWQAHTVPTIAGVVMPTSPTTADTASAPLEGTIEARTITAALLVFADHVLKGQPEEIASGEWLGPDDIEALIADVKRRYV